MNDKNMEYALELVRVALEIAAETADRWAAEWAPHDIAPVSVGDTIRSLDKQTIITVVDTQ